MRGPVGSLAAPDHPDEYAPVDAGTGLTVYVHKALMSSVEGKNGCSFVFGLFGRGSIVPA